MDTRRMMKSKKLVQKGDKFYDDGTFDKAIECYLKAIKINPHYADAYYNMGVVYGEERDYDQAIECYKKAIEIDQDYVNAYYNMGVAYQKQSYYGFEEEAIECYQKAVEIDKDNADAYYNMGYAYQKIATDNIDEEEIEEEDDDINKYPDIVKNLDKAIECYQKAVEIKKDYAKAYHNMGLAYKHKENYDKAIECYQKAVEIDQDFADAYYNMGLAYGKKGVKLSASDSFYQAGLLFLEQEDPDNVENAIDQMEEYTPDSPLIKKLKDKLYEE
jgi:superkiller protein 3